MTEVQEICSTMNENKYYPCILGNTNFQERNANKSAFMNGPLLDNQVGCGGK